MGEYTNDDDLRRAKDFRDPRRTVDLLVSGGYNPSSRVEQELVQMHEADRIARVRAVRKAYEKLPRFLYSSEISEMFGNRVSPARMRAIKEDQDQDFTDGFPRGQLKTTLMCLGFKPKEIDDAVLAYAATLD